MLNGMHHLPLVLLSADAGKAFDKVAWTFLQATLEHIGFGEGIRALKLWQPVTF